MSMKPWERDIIEYRPNIGLDREIITKIIKRATIEGKVYEPSKTVSQSVTILGTDLVERAMSILSDIYNTRNKIEQHRGNHPSFVSYKQALKDGDDAKASEIHESNLTDIIGIPELDVYPILKEMEDELTQYLDYLNEELFNGEADYSDLSPVRTKEESMLSSILEAESEDLSHQENPDYTEEHRKMIQRVIDDKNNNIKSINDYEKHMRGERRKSGSPRVDYARLQDRSRFLATVSEKLKGFRDRYGRINHYLGSGLKEYLHEDVIGGLEYLVEVYDYNPNDDIPPRPKRNFNDMKTAIETAHKRHTYDAIQSYHNMGRVTDRKVREYLDEKLSDVRRKKQRLVDGLRGNYKRTNIDNDGSQAIVSALEEGIMSVDMLWKQIVAEHIANTEQNIDQMERLMGRLGEKKRHQTIYLLLDLIEKEFDFDNRDKELPNFIRTHRLDYNRYR